MTIILRGKELLLDHHGELAKYPQAVPRLFHLAPAEDYSADVCTHLCQYQRNVSWKSLFDYKLDTCQINNDSGADRVTKYQLCSSNDCRNETAFASNDYFVEYLKFDEANLSETQTHNRNSFFSMGNSIKIWIKSDCSFYTIKNINLKKKFEEFLAEIGGNFGLFAGASILTLVEIGEFLVVIFKRSVVQKIITNQTEETVMPLSSQAK